MTAQGGPRAGSCPRSAAGVDLRRVTTAEDVAAYGQVMSAARGRPPPGSADDDLGTRPPGPALVRPLL
jgi:hypothetical protein